jgi:signal transduction histidine kinase/CheY-like chemotaxis protein/ligand-binding sensor domain-containing protein
MPIHLNYAPTNKSFPSKLQQRSATKNCFNQIILVIGALFLYSPVYANDWVPYDIKHYNTENSLQDNHVYQTFQDSRQFIWVVTATGLDFYDGSQFIRIKKWPRLDLITNAQIRFEDAQHRLWLRLVENGKVQFYLIDSRTFQVQKAEPALNIRWHEKLFDAAQWKNGSIYLSTYSGKIFRYNYKSNQCQKLWQSRIGKMKILNTNFKSNQFWLLAIDILDSTTTFICLNIKGKFLHQIDHPGAVISQALNNGELSYVTAREMVIVYPNGHQKQIPLEEISNRDATLQNYSYPILGLNSFDDGILYLFENQLIKIKTTTKSSSIPIRMKGNNAFYDAYHVFQDKRQAIWVSTINGLFKITPLINHFERQIWIDPLEKKSSQVNSCRGIFEAKDGTVYAGINGRLYQKKSTEKTFTYLTAFSGDLYAIEGDSAGQVWMGRSDLLQYNPLTGMVQFHVPSRWGLIWSILPEKDKVWVGTEKNLAYWDKSKQQFVFFGQYNGFDALKESIVYQIEPFEQTKHLLLTTSTGLYVLDRSKGIIARYWTGGRGKFHLPADNIQHTCRVSKNEYWLASTTGLVAWNPIGVKTRFYTTESGLPDNNLCAVYDDQAGYLWISSYNGIAQFQKKTGKVRTFGTIEGITHKEFNRISHGKGKDGTIYFGGLNGVTAFQPRDFHQDFDQHLNAPVFLTQAKVFSSTSKKEVDKLKEYQYKKEITLLPGDKYLQLKFGLPNTDLQVESIFAFKIKEEHTHWQPTQNNAILLSGLSPGIHTLIFKSKSSINTQEECRVQIRVLPPLYARPWFVILFLTILVTCVCVWLNYLFNKHAQQEQELQSRIDKKTRQILEDKAIIQQQVERLAKFSEEKTRFVTGITHELRTPLSLVLSPLQKLSQSKNLLPTEKSLIEMSTRNANQLLKVINEILYVNASEQFLDSEFKVIPIELIVSKLIREYRILAKMKNIKIRFINECKVQPKVFAIEKELEMVFSNLLSNAIKFTPQHGQVMISLQEGSLNQINISIADNGGGIQPNDLPYVFERYFQAGSGDLSAEGGTGIGLYIALEFAKKAGGNIQVESELGKGSVFKVILPLYASVEETLSSDTVALEFPSSNTNKFSEVHNQKNPDKTNPKILLVEDNPDMARLLTTSLDQYYEVSTASDGQSAIDFLHSNPLPDLIVCDIMMPQMNGFQFIEFLKSKDAYAQIPVLIQTAVANSKDRQKAKRLGISEYLIKPYEEKELLRIVQKMIPIKKENSPNDDLLQQLRKEKLLPSLLHFHAEDNSWLQHFEKMVLSLMAEPDFSTDQLANHLGITRMTLYRKLFKLTGIKPNDYLNELRLQAARLLLETQSHPDLNTVLELIGVKDSRYFEKKFTARFGKKPVSYF